MTDFRRLVPEVRALVQQHLVGLVDGDLSPQQAYLFKENRFVGVRFRIGNHRGDWLFGEPTLKIFQQASLLPIVSFDLPAKLLPPMESITLPMPTVTPPVPQLPDEMVARKAA